MLSIFSVHRQLYFVSSSCVRLIFIFLLLSRLYILWNHSYFHQQSGVVVWFFLTYTFQWFGLTAVHPSKHCIVRQRCIRRIIFLSRTKIWFSQAPFNVYLSVHNRYESKVNESLWKQAGCRFFSSLLVVQDRITQEPNQSNDLTVKYGCGCG